MGGWTTWFLCNPPNFICRDYNNTRMFNLLMMKILVCFYFHYKNKYTYLSSSLAKCTVQNSRMSWRWASRIKDLTSENTCLYVILTNSSSITIMVDWVYSPGIYTALTELVRTGENDLRPTLHTDTALILIILLPHPEKSNGRQQQPTVIMIERERERGHIHKHFSN